MAETIFVALFVILPLAAALLFLVYRSRLLLRNIMVVAVLAMGIWGVLKLVSTEWSVFERRAAEPAVYQPASCFATARSEPGKPMQDCML